MEGAESAGEQPLNDVEYFLNFEQQLLQGVMISTATRSELSIEQTPSIVTVFRREDIERLGARQLVDLLRYVPGFFEVSGQLERNVAIRGIHASSPDHFVVLVDGLNMNDFLFSSASPEAFSLEYAEQVEIIRGPGSSIYGANALMGVINIITRTEKEPRVQEKLTLGTHGFFRNDATFGTSLGEDRTFYAAASFWRHDGTPFTASAREDVLTPSQGQNISDGIQAGENLTQPRAHAPVAVNRYGPSFNVFVKYKHDDSSAVRLLVARNEYHLPRTYRQAFFSPGVGTQTPQYSTERLVLDVEKKWGSRDGAGELTFRPSFMSITHDMRSQGISPEFYASAQKEQASIIYRWSGRDIRISPSLEYAVNIPDFWIFTGTGIVAGFQPEYDIASDYSMTRCFLDSERNFAPSIYATQGGDDVFCTDGVMLREGMAIDAFGGITQTEGSLMGDGDELRLGTFLQLTTTLPRNVGLVVGGRLDYNLVYSPQFSPRVALVAPLSGGLYSKAQYASSFVYPAFLYRTGNSLSDYQGNPEIEPQSIDTFEGLLGFKNNFVRAELSGYYNRVRRFITFDLSRNSKTGQYKFSNQGDLDIVGVEATALMSFNEGRLTVNLHGTYAHPLPSTSDLFLVDGKLGGPTKFPELMGGVVVTYNPWKALQLTVGTLYSAPVRQNIAVEAQFDGIEGTDGQVYSSLPADEYDTLVLDLNASVTYSFLEDWKVGVTASNILNRRAYRPGSVLVPYLAEGRIVTASLSRQF
ncbi:MAG: TonB-dependent receptor [Myxococcaceae bacterium]